MIGVIKGKMEDSNGKHESIMMTVNEVSKYLRVSTNEVYRLCNQRNFPAVKLGKSWAIHKDQLDEWILKQFRLHRKKV